MHNWTILCITLFLGNIANSVSHSSVRLVNSTDKLFNQIAEDLAPYEAGISSAMVDSVYCSTIAPGFRLQIKDQEVYIAGEVRGFQSRNRNIKLALLEVASQFKILPNVDLVIGTDDFSADGTGMTGPIFAQVSPNPCV